ncbi:MAG: hypothetical protein ABW208_07870 [Pyrinomonadaceae bacterium]
MAHEHARQGDCTADWSIAWSGERRWTPLLPDMHATYWYYAVTRVEGDKVGFELHAQFGHARYQGFNVYNDVTGDLVWGSGSGRRSSFRDEEIEPDEGSQNPYRLYVPRDTLERDYTLHLVPEGSDTSGYRNCITFPADVTQLSVYLRVYLPDQHLKGHPHYLSGGVPLPRIRAFDTGDGLPAACPPTRPIPGTGTLPPGPGANTDGQVHFYRVTAKDYYPNHDNAYLATVFEPIGDNVALIRVRPPTYTNTSDPAAPITEVTQVRYWSFNVYSIELSNVTACLADFEAEVAPDGFVYLVLGRRRPAILDKAEGFNFLPWGLHEKIALVYRHMAPDTDNFKQSAAAVPIYDSALPREDQAAERYIGEYAPSGVYCPGIKFVKDFCAPPWEMP